MNKQQKNDDFFEREDWTLFRNPETLPQKAGVPSSLIPRLVAKELADNALDSAGQGGNCRVGVIENGFFIEDNGPGIKLDDEGIARLFSMKRPMTSSKQFRLPTRGALGNGLRVVTGAVFCSNGGLKVSTRGRALALIPRYDGSTDFKRISSFDGQGTRIEVTLPGYDTTDCLYWAKWAIAFTGGKHFKGKTSAHWHSLESFIELLRSAPKDMTVLKFIAQFDGCSGNKAGQIAGNVSSRPTRSLTDDEARQLLLNGRSISKEVNPKRLGYVGKFVEYTLPEKREGSYRKVSEHYGINSTIPYIVEAWAKPSSDSKVLFFVNRTPVAASYESDCFFDQKGKKLEVSGCNLYFTVAAKRETTLLISVITPYMPLTDDNKKPDLSYMSEDIIATAQKATKKASRLKKVASAFEKEKNQKEVILNNLDPSISKASGNGQYRYSERQLFYVIRPLLREEMEKMPDFNYFKKVIAAHEKEIGHDLPGIYRDERGSIYIPHIGLRIPLGTLKLEKHIHQKYLCNKALYIEKEGFFEILIAEKWPEKHDCILLTSKGYASRAAKDYLDMIGESGDDILFFCVHDADAYGTTIHQSLQEETQTRAGRTVAVKNLGLDPWEGIQMELQVESVEDETPSGKKRKRKPVAQYIRDYFKADDYDNLRNYFNVSPPDNYDNWDEWLQDYRIELNAMDTPIFLQWLNDKMAEHGKGKLIPPTKIMITTLKEESEAQLNKEIYEQLTAKLKIKARVKKEIKKLLPKVLSQAETFHNTLPRMIRNELSKKEWESWKDPIRRLSNKLIRKVLL